MKKLLLLALLAFLAASCSKSKEKDPAPDATASFTASRRVVEVNEEVRFTNTSTGATRYVWTFGNGQTSTQQAPTVKYAATGRYNVTLVTYNSDNLAWTQSIQLLVGRRYLTEVRLQNLAYFQPSGLPWDTDGTGPDLNMYFDCLPLTGTQVFQQQSGIFRDVTPARLPGPWNLNGIPVSRLPKSTFTFRMTEHSISNSRVIFADSVAMTAPSADRNSMGAGTYTYQSPDGTWRFAMNYITSF